MGERYSQRWSWFLLLMVSTYASHLAYSQADSNVIKGSPRVIHYTKNDFHGSAQFWAMCEDAQGVLYFGNNDGVLIFDGETWLTVNLPNGSTVRSLKVSNEGTVYAGGFNELGTINKDSVGNYYYKSLLPLVRTEDRNMGNISQIDEVKGHIIFRSFIAIFALANGKIVSIPTTSAYTYTTVLNDSLYVYDAEGLKLLELQSLKFTVLVKSAEFKKEDLVALLPGSQPEEFLALTRQGSLYRYNSKLNTLVFEQRLIPENSPDLITCGLRARNNNYYIGTLRSKIFTLNDSGKNIFSNSFSALQDNTVLNLFETNEGNIWALLNNGIDCINLSSPVSLLFENASVYDVLVKDDYTYIATNQGVFIASITRSQTANNKIQFYNIKGLEGQVWSIQSIHNKVLCSHDFGLFSIEGNSFKQIKGVSGVWKVLAIKDRPNEYLVCTYSGLYLMEYKDSTGFKITRTIEGFGESSRDIEAGNEPGVFWICHGYKGVFRIRIENEFKRVIAVEHFTNKNGLPSSFNINVFRWKDEIVFTTNEGIYTFDEKSSQFKPHKFLTTLFGADKNVRKLFQHREKTWFVHDDEVGYFLTDAAEPILKKGLFLTLKGSLNRSMECVIPLGEQKVIVGTTTGLYAFNLNYKLTKEASTLITHVEYQENNVEKYAELYASRLKLSHQTTNIGFRFAAPHLQDKVNVQYSYILDDVDNRWSRWQEPSFHEYSHLRPGRYTFRVKARSLLGENAKEAVYHFEILPVWYLTR